MKPMTPAAYQTRHIYNQFVITCDRRDELRQWLAEKRDRDRDLLPAFPPPAGLFRRLGYKEGDFPVSEDLTRRVLALPVYPELHPEDIDYVVDRIAAFGGWQLR